MYCSCPVQSRNWATHPLPLHGFVVCMSTHQTKRVSVATPLVYGFHTSIGTPGQPTAQRRDFAQR